MHRTRYEEITRRAREEPTPERLLAYAMERLHPRVALASSFGAEDVVLIDMLCGIVESPRIFTLDTGRLGQETYELMDRIRERYRIEIEVAFPEPREVAELVRTTGLNGFYQSRENRQACCRVRKIHPLRSMLAGLDGWICGLRAEQTTTRAEAAAVELDAAHGGIVKLNPLIDWSAAQVWEYIRRREVPYNPLHDAGYPSIGCRPCTRAVRPGEDPRAGRWWWEQKTDRECGLHVNGGSAGKGSWDATG